MSMISNNIDCQNIQLYQLVNTSFQIEALKSGYTNDYHDYITQARNFLIKT